MLTTGSNFFQRLLFYKLQSSEPQYLNFFMKLSYRIYSKMGKWQDQI